MSTLPKSQAILNYQDFFGPELSDNPLSLIHDLDKTTVLAEFAGLNYRLKPKTTMYYDTSLKTQQKELLYFSGNNRELFNKHYSLFAKHINSEKDYSIIFTRQTCLYAFEQITNSDIPHIDGFTMRDSWPKLFQYVLAVNGEITRQTNEVSERAASLEEMNPRMIPLNELSINVDPLYLPYRGYHLLSYFANHTELSPFFLDYFQKTYNLPFEHFIYELLSMYFANNKDGINNITTEFGEQLDTSFYYSVAPNDQAMFDSLSKVIKNEKTERLISIRKSPFYKSPLSKYLLMDSVLLMDKSYSQFINDFWFDCVKYTVDENGKARFNIRNYRGVVGKFIETYCDTVIRHSFHNAKYHILKTFDELKYKVGREEKELTDVYIRYNRKIFISEVKTTGLYDEEKYSGEINELYKNNREGFFESFGVNQIVRGIKLLREHVATIDQRFPMDQQCQVYPAIIVNEKAMQTPLMAQIFNNRFKELMQEVVVEKLTIHPLSLIHISDLEHMEDHLHKSPDHFWKLIRYHLRDQTFIPPFYNTLDRKNIKPNFKRTRKLFEELILKYQRI